MSYHWHDLTFGQRLRLRIGSLLARKIGNVRYHPGIWLSRKPEHRITIALAELRAQGWREMHLAPEHTDVLVIEGGSHGHHRAFRDGQSWWMRAPSHVAEDDLWPSNPLLWKPLPS